MTTPFLVRGDPLPELGHLILDPGSGGARGLLWGVNLTGCHTRKEARTAWREAVSAVNAELDAHPEIRRICLACSRPTQFPQTPRIRIPEGLALRLHNDFERDRARYICVLALDVSDCSDPELLYDRLCEALVGPVPWSDLRIAWDSIADRSVIDAWVNNTI